MRSLLATAVLVALPGLVFAAHPRPLVNGTIVGDEALYGAPLFVQPIQTSFGDTNDPDPKTAGADPNPLDGGSEMDAIYATVTGGRLYVLMTGNLEDNFNKWDLFVDSIDGGFNVMPSDPLNDQFPEVDGFCCGAPNDGEGAIQHLTGLTFDSGFEADYFMTFANGLETEQTTGDENQSWAFTAHFSPLQRLNTAQPIPGPLPPDPSSQWGAVGGNHEAQVAGGVLIDQFSADPNTNPFENFYIERATDNTEIGLRVTIDNSNIAGIAGSSTGDAADQVAAAAVPTGIEWSIPLKSIGYPSGDIKISTFINNGSHEYLSNQVSGGLPVGFGDLAADGMGTLTHVNFEDINGTQFVTVGQTDLLGDMDCDGDIDFDDIDDFVLSLANPDQYEATFGVPPDLKGDTDGDGDVDFDDIQGLVTILTGGGAGLHAQPARGVPEPATWTLVLAAGLVGIAGSWRRNNPIWRAQGRA